MPVVILAPKNSATPAICKILRRYLLYGKIIKRIYGAERKKG